MGEGEETAAAINPVIRIFIGGLGSSVTATDLKKTFSSLGKVSSIEFVRSDGRNFAFMDFEPNSDKALAKLFAIYNGCTWKGGRLRLERAKEHYLARLKREWAEDTKVVTSVDLEVEKKPDDSSKIRHLNQENMQLQIFFPKLRKVKALPFRGSGKHKYSFQRIEVPSSLPVHFCDCEEHCGPSEIATEKYLSTLNSMAYEKERSIMNTVMSKLLVKEKNAVPAPEMINFPTEAKIMGSSNNCIQMEEIENQDEEVDNLVTNIGMMRQSDDMLMQLLGRKMHAVDQALKSRINTHQTSKDDLTQNKEHPRKRQKTATTDDSELKFTQASSVKTRGKTAENQFAFVSSKNGNTMVDEKKEICAGVSPDKRQTEQKTVKSGTSSSWIQKSSWRDLVGDSGNSPFSLLNVLPGIPLVEPKLSTADGEGSGPLEVKHGDQPEKNVAFEMLARKEIEKAVAEHDNEEQNSSSLLQKTFWRDLVQDSGNSSFSISTILPGITSVEPKLSDARDSAFTSNRRTQSHVEGSGQLEGKDGTQPKKTAAPSVVEMLALGDRDKAITEHGNEEHKKNSYLKQRIIPQIEIGQVCTFMRSAESEKQWKKAKTALSGYLKKKSRVTNASKEYKGKPSWR